MTLFDQERIHVIWPSDQYVTGSQINAWYQDAIANGELSPLPGYPDSLEKARALHNEGLITLGAEETRSRQAAAWERLRNSGLHHEECQCNLCYYGEDAGTWLFNPGEY